VVERGGSQAIPRPKDWLPGKLAPWHGFDRFLGVEHVANALLDFTPSQLVRGPAVDRPDNRGRDSAVLVLLYDGPDGATTVLTKRALHMRKHAGEIAFPGGAIDAEDQDPWAAARREAYEEVALDPALPQRLGELDRFVTGASYSLVTPLVASLTEPPDLEASPDEVHSILHVSLAELLDPAVYREERWMFDGQYRSLYFFELAGETVWGATALMLHRLLTLVTDS